MNRIVVGVDIAKRVFQLHWVEPATGEIVALQLKREKFLEHFANRAGCLIGMEACGGSQHWARALQNLGHEVKLMSACMIKPFVCGNKNDAAFLILQSHQRGSGRSKLPRVASYSNARSFMYPERLMGNSVLSCRTATRLSFSDSSIFASRDTLRI
jgi:transposase